jgi:hypothetical protein
MYTVPDNVNTYIGRKSRRLNSTSTVGYKLLVTGGQRTWEGQAQSSCIAGRNGWKNLNKKNQRNSTYSTYQTRKKFIAKTIFKTIVLRKT